jgi:hypothetical protein
MSISGVHTPCSTFAVAEAANPKAGKSCRPGEDLRSGLYSKAAVAVSRELNPAGIEEARVDIRLATVSNLPFGDSVFDLVTAVETHYYWCPIEREICWRSAAYSSPEGAW